MNDVVDAAPFTLITSVIDKLRLRERYSYPDNPYEVALRFCVERAYTFLKEKGQQNRLARVVVEKRGEKEDKDLELAFRRIAEGAGYRGPFPFEIVFADKKMNSSGLQLADLVAYPIGRHVLKPGQPNPAYEIVQQKFRRSPTGKVDGYGLKVFP